MSKEDNYFFIQEKQYLKRCIQKGEFRYKIPKSKLKICLNCGVLHLHFYYNNKKCNMCHLKNFPYFPELSKTCIAKK